MTPTDQELLYKFINAACTNEQVRSVLRKKKRDHKKVKIGASSEEVMRNLRDARDRLIINDSELATLLAAGEENGRQHIFLYRLTNRAKERYKDVRGLKQRMTVALGAPSDRLPHFVLKPSKRTVSDVRVQKLANEDFNLIIKWYSGRQVEHVVNQEKFEKNGDHYIRRESKIEDVRLVSVARFLPRGLLEIRVPTGERESRKTCLDELAEIRGMIDPVLREGDFVALDLSKSMRWLQDNDGKKGMKHRVSAAQAADGDARAEFNPAVEGQGLFGSLRHREAMKKYDDFARLDVYWRSPLKRELKKSDDRSDEDEEEIRCQMGLYQVNGIRIGAKRAAEEIDFVVNRLWDLSK